MANAKARLGKYKIVCALLEERGVDCVSPNRYDTLVLTGKAVTVRYSDGEFKISGTYGKYVWKPEE